MEFQRNPKENFQTVPILLEKKVLKLLVKRIEGENQYH